jgi:hypothetical protein
VRYRLEEANDFFAYTQFTINDNKKTCFRNPSLPDVRWEPLTESDPNYLNIGAEFTMQQHLLKDRMAFWDDLRQSVKK